jgi:hypothetical protein
MHQAQCKGLGLLAAMAHAARGQWPLGDALLSSVKSECWWPGGLRCARHSVMQHRFVQLKRCYPMLIAVFRLGDEWCCCRRKRLL